MTVNEAKEILLTEKEVTALDEKSYVLFLELGLDMLMKGAYPIAKINKGY